MHEGYLKAISSIRSERAFAAISSIRSEHTSTITAKQVQGHWTLLLVISGLSAAFGSSFQFGFHIGVLNIPEQVMRRWINGTDFSYDNTTDHAILQQQDTLWSTAVTIRVIGGMIGSLSLGTVADKLGRKMGLLYNNGITILACSLMISSKYIGTHWLFMAGRLIIGVSSGLNSGLVPMYLTEIAPPNLISTIDSFAPLFVTISIVSSQIIGLPSIFGTRERWPFIFAFAFVPVIFQLLTLPFCPESPKYTLIFLNRKEQAEADLKRLRQEDDVSAEMQLINEEAEVERAETKVTYKKMFGKKYRWPLALVIFMMTSQQLSGNTAAFFYSGQIFRGAGLDQDLSNLATIVMGSINVLMTMVTVYLVDHSKFGRRTLHIGGLSGMCTCSVLIVISMHLAKTDKSMKWMSYMSAIFVLLFVISYATGPGIIPWFYVNELFPPESREKANSFGVFTCWFTTFIVGQAFPIVADKLEEFAFLVFTGLLTFFILFALKYLPETKDKRLKYVWREMERRWEWRICGDDEEEEKWETKSRTRTLTTTDEEEEDKGKILYV